MLSLLAGPNLFTVNAINLIEKRWFYKFIVAAVWEFLYMDLHGEMCK